MMLTPSKSISSSSSSRSRAGDNNALAEQIKQAQLIIGKVQNLYGNSDIRFWALELAWESVRLAWCEVANGHNGDRLRNVENALNDYQRVVEAKR